MVDELFDPNERAIIDEPEETLWEDEEYSTLDICPDCDGAGYVIERRNRWMPCKRCEGTGYVIN